jgi:hypothetical protein
MSGIIYCDKCHKRESCTKLCDKAKEYVDQDVVQNSFILLDDRQLDWFHIHTKIPNIQHRIVSGSINFRFLSSLENKILTLFYVEGLSYQEILKKINRGKYSPGLSLKDLSRLIHSAKGVLRSNFAVSNGHYIFTGHDFVYRRRNF